MKLLVTGAAGFVGSALVNCLSVNGVDVLAGVRKLSTDLPRSVEQIVIGDLLALAENVTDLQSSLFDGVGIVVHAAARVHIMNDDASDPLDAFRKVNRDATLALARMAAAFGVKRFVFLSSIKVNGEMTRPSCSFSPNDEHTPTDPMGCLNMKLSRGC